MPFHEWLPQRRAGTTHFYFPRYRKWLEQIKGFAPAVLGVLDKDTDKVVGLLEDPERSGAWKRRGLVVGHVQSGKTANYTGVICKAADYGYRFIVLLTGVQENLRVQTQERIEDGIIGLNSEATSGGRASGVTGVGLFGLDRRPMSLTSRTSDFSIEKATGRSRNMTTRTSAPRSTPVLATAPTLCCHSKPPTATNRACWWRSPANPNGTPSGRHRVSAICRSASGGRESLNKWKARSRSARLQWAA